MLSTAAEDHRHKAGFGAMLCGIYRCACASTSFRKRYSVGKEVYVGFSERIRIVPQ
jgi:hypothetical protein